MDTTYIFLNVCRHLVKFERMGWKKLINPALNSFLTTHVYVCNQWVIQSHSLAHRFIICLTHKAKRTFVTNAMKTNNWPNANSTRNENSNKNRLLTSMDMYTPEHYV